MSTIMSGRPQVTTATRSTRLVGDQYAPTSLYPFAAGFVSGICSPFVSFFLFLTAESAISLAFCTIFWS